MERIKMQTHSKIGSRTFAAGDVLETDAAIARTLVLAGSATYAGEDGTNRTTAVRSQSRLWTPEGRRTSRPLPAPE